MRAAEAVDFSGNWTRFWANAQSLLTEQQMSALGTIGVILVVASLIGMLWSRSRGRNSSSSGFLYTLAIGAVLASPGVIIPMALSVVDAIVNFVLGLFTAAV